MLWDMRMKVLQRCVLVILSVNAWFACSVSFDLLSSMNFHSVLFYSVSSCSVPFAVHIRPETYVAL
jgi:hypothetical protein